MIAREEIFKILKDYGRWHTLREEHKAAALDGAMLLAVALEHGVPLQTLQRAICTPDGEEPETAIAFVIETLALKHPIPVGTVKKTERSEGLTAAIDKAGGVKRLATLLGIGVKAVEQWDKVPVERMAQIERFVGIPRQQLRPDLFKADGGAS